MQISQQLLTRVSLNIIEKYVRDFASLDIVNPLIRIAVVQCPDFQSQKYSKPSCKKGAKNWEMT